MKATSMFKGNNLLNLEFKRILFILILSPLLGCKDPNPKSNDQPNSLDQTPKPTEFKLTELGQAKKYFLSRDEFVCSGNQLESVNNYLPIQDKLTSPNTDSSTALTELLKISLSSLSPPVIRFMAQMKVQFVIQNDIDAECGLKKTRSCWIQSDENITIYLSPFFEGEFFSTAINHLPLILIGEIIYERASDFSQRFQHQDPSQSIAQLVQKTSIVADNEYEKYYTDQKILPINYPKLYSHLFFSSVCNQEWKVFTHKNFPYSYSGIQFLEKSLFEFYQKESLNLTPKSPPSLFAGDMAFSPVPRTFSEHPSQFGEEFQQYIGSSPKFGSTTSMISKADFETLSSTSSSVRNMGPRTISDEKAKPYRFRENLQTVDILEDSQFKSTPILGGKSGPVKCCEFDTKGILVRPKKSGIYENKNLVTILVHGTFSPHKVKEANGWVNPDSNFADQLRQDWGGDVLSFVWSGKQNKTSREEAGKQLAEEITKLKNTGATIRVVSHSHGGNVTLHAIKQLTNNKTPFKGAAIEQFHSIARPNRDYEVKRNSQVFDSNIAWIGNYSSKSDIVQLGGSQVRSLFKGKVRVDKEANENIILTEAVGLSHTDMHKSSFLNLVLSKGVEMDKKFKEWETNKELSGTNSVLRTLFQD